MFNSMKSMDVSGKTVLVRVDFNCPLKDGEVADDNRIQAALPTIYYLLENNAKLVLMSHLGRPKGEKKPELSLAPVAKKLGSILGKEVKMAPDCVGAEVKNMVTSLEPGDILVLENLRFHPEEKKDNEEFAAQLAELADVYVNDAFGAAHRAHASTHAVAKMLPAGAGLLMERELEVLGRLLDEPKRPFVAILGGAKVTDKIGVLKNLSKIADHILIGGGMAFTFAKLQGHEIGKSLCEKDLDLSREIWDEANSNKAKVHMPTDVAIGPEFAAMDSRIEVGIDQIPTDQMGLDIGSKTIEQFSKIVAEAGTVCWNGPMGAFEIEPFDQGTLKVAQAIAASDAVSCVGGGDSAAAIRQMGLADEITHVSTGGGASLELLEGKELPGVAVLKSKVC
jgi:3-phosphoglycerate kinase